MNKNESVIRGAMLKGNETVGPNKDPKKSSLIVKLSASACLNKDQRFSRNFFRIIKQICLSKASKLYLIVEAGTFVR